MPEVTVVDPSGGDGHGDLLACGDDRPARQVPRRRVVAALVVLLLAAGSVTAVRAERRERAAEQAAAAAFAIADRVHLRARLEAVAALEPGSQRIDAVVALEPEGASYSGPRDRVESVTVEGDQLTSVGDPPDPLGVREGVVQAAAAVDCGAVAVGRLPAAASVVVTVVPASGVRHPQRLPVDAGLLREVVLEACDLADPDLSTVVEVAGQADGAVLLVDAVPRSTGPAVVEALSVEGFEVLPDGFSLPYVVAPGSGAFLGLRLRLLDCAAARAGAGQLEVRLSDPDGRSDRTAGPLTSQPQPGTRPLAELVQRLVDEGC